MHIAIDIREACRERPTGKGVWTLGCIRQILLSADTYSVLSDAPVPREWEELPNVQVVRLRSGFLWHLRCARWLLSVRPDWYLSPTSFLVPAFVGCTVRTAVVVHDLIAFRSEPHAWKPRMLERLFLPRAVRCARAVLCVSGATRQDLLVRFPRIHPERCVAVYAGPTASAPRFNVPDNCTIACIATLCPRKNHMRLIEAYALLPDALRSRFRLVLAGGRGWQDADLLRMVECTEGVEWRGYVSPDAYDALLTTCTVFAYPSLYEGFGLPVLDALQRGAAVLTSSRGSLGEVADDAALLVDPEDTQSIAHGLEQLLTDAPMRDALRERAVQQAAHYTWKRTASLVHSTLSAV